MILFELGHILVLILLANIHAYLIKKSKKDISKPLHWGNFIIQGTIAFICGYLYWWPAIIIIALHVRIFFDSLLNVFRGERLNYIPVKPSSWFDKTEIKIFGRDWYWPRAIYLAISFGLNITYLVFIK